MGYIIFKMLFIYWKNIDKINWSYLSANENAKNLIEKNLDKINWYYLSKNPNAIHLLEKYPDNINWSNLSCCKHIFKLDYYEMKKNCESFAEEIAKYVFNPKRLHRFSEKYNLTFEEILIHINFLLKN